MSNAKAPTSGVYALVDPRTQRVMYIGQAVDFSRRYQQHLDPHRYDGNRAKVRWIRELGREGWKPVLVVLKECAWPESDAAEKELIRAYRLRGEAELNIASGGSGCDVSRLKRSTQEDWFQLGVKIKHARSLLFDIAHDVERLASKKQVKTIDATIRHVDRLKAELDGMLSRAFPEWEDFTRVFYGPEEREAG